MRIKFSKIGAVLLALMLMSTFALGETAMVMPKQYFFDGDGDPLAGGKIYTYEPSTQIPKDTFTTEAGTTPNPNPVILNSEGYSAIYIGGSYAIKVTDSDDVTIWTADPVSSYVTDADLSSYVSYVDLSDPTPGSGSDLVAHTGTADTVTEALTKKVDIDGDTMTGDLILDDSTAISPRIHLETSAGESVGIDANSSSGFLRLVTDDGIGGGDITRIAVDMGTGECSAWDLGTSQVKRILTEGDEGDGNGLDADTVDGLHATDFAFRGALVYLTSDVTGIISGANGTIDWEAESYDTGAFWDVADPERLTIPSGISKVRLRAQINWIPEAAATGYRGFELIASATSSADPFMSSFMQVSSDQTNGTVHSAVSGIIDVTPGDYFLLRVRHLQGATTDVRSGGAPRSTWFEIEVIE